MASGSFVLKRRTMVTTFDPGRLMADRAFQSMPPRYEILHLFSASNGHLAEVKRLDQATGAPRTNVNHWLWIEDRAVLTLQFRAMETSPRQQRIFEEAILWFDEVRGELHWRGGRLMPLTVQADKVVIGTLRSRIGEHLS